MYFVSIYDSLSKKKINLLLNKLIKIYVCGPTVYDYCHIGHARSFIVFDAIRRILQEYTEVYYVQNITDIAEKISQKASKEGKTEKEIVSFYLQKYEEDQVLLNIQKPNCSPLPTNYIQDIIDYIQKLLSLNKAYIIEDGIYFKTESITYGNFEQRPNGDKSNFALWKFSNENNVFNSPWGCGIPGWHIECSVMSEKLLGINFDIHGGGSDLKFPHHENEIAQCLGKNDCYPCKIWIHNGLINVNGDKMSKSCNNFWFIKDIIKNSFEADSMRYLFLSYNYNVDVEITMETIEKAKKTMKNIRLFYFQHLILVNTSLCYKKEIFEIVKEDFNIPKLLSMLNEAINICDYNLSYYLLKVLGFKMENLCKLTHENILCLIEERMCFKKNMDFTNSDKIRNFLEENFIQLNDSNKDIQWFFF